MVFCLLKKHKLNKSKFLRDYLSYTRHCIFFPIVQIFQMIPSTINKVYLLFAEEENVYCIGAQIIFSSLVGLMFSILFCSLPEVRASTSKILENIKYYFCCKWYFKFKDNSSKLAKVNCGKEQDSHNVYRVSEDGSKLKNNKALTDNLLENLTMNIIHKRKHQKSAFLGNPAQKEGSFKNCEK